MKTVQIVKAGTDEVIASFTEYPDPEGIRGIMALLGITSVEFCRMGGKGDGPEDPGAE